MAFVTPKNLISPLTNKTVLFLWIFIALLFAVARSSGVKLTVHSVQPPTQMIQQSQLGTISQPARPKPQSPKFNANTNDSYLPFGFNGLNKEEEEAPKPTGGSESLDDIFNQM